MNKKKFNLISLIGCLVLLIGCSINPLTGQNCFADFDAFESPGNTLAVSFISMSSPVDSIFNYRWDYGDGNVDSAAQFQVVVHTFDTAGVYEVCLTIFANDTFSGVCDTTFCEFIEVCANPMWPGDANNDGVANNFDILPLGLMFGQSGIASDDTSSEWNPRCIADWNDSIVGTITNLKYSDGNGDGSIGPGDVSAIDKNYGFMHNKMLSSPCFDPVDPPMFFVFSQTIVEAGTAVDVDIHLGTAVNPIVDAYGVVFSVNYDPNFVDSNSVKLNYDMSIFQDSVDSSITIQNDQYGLGRIDGGIVRTNFQSVSGFGPVARLSFVMEDDLVQRPEDLSDSIIELPVILEFSDVLVIDQNNAPIDYCAKTDSFVVFQVLTGIEKGREELDVRVLPNPFSNQLSVNNLGSGEKHVALYDVLGKQIRSVNLSHRQGQLKLVLGDLLPGVYIIKVKTKSGELVKKLIKR